MSFDENLDLTVRRFGQSKTTYRLMQSVVCGRFPYEGVLRVGGTLLREPMAAMRLCLLCSPSMSPGRVPAPR